MITIDPEPISVRIPAAMKMTGISRSRLFELLRAGEIDSVKLGTSRLILVESLRLFLEKLQSEQQTARSA
ncbi:helix-turn-helix domain-containing protein [Sphingomonas sp. MMSM20]|uniref:helix-turn-helix domain-containing protein n=1 Tax=Sphingomonas lycopersici TaxID=2951807 RepID=UPI002237F171|nr:helix-turn-helix domain-containing protein [Sphingomonas lycopersici]MCW6530676.1 helix-turn-helix domain-containing protein [Sphingomonas lycopersici]